VRLIISYAAGNATDSLARIVADKLSTQWGQAVTVENRPGQGGSIGAQTAVKAPADGYTLLFSAMAAMAINPHVYSNLVYDVRKDFAPIINVAYPSSLIVATPGLKINTLKRLPQLPDLPTVSELVTGDVPVVPWLGIFAPVGTPPAIIAKVTQDVTATLSMPDVQQRFSTVGLTTSGDGPQEFARTINSDYERLGKLVKQLGLKVD
jgi:tripartite-type tricarboxylate transporter receptor subunit TctC